MTKVNNFWQPKVDSLQLRIPKEDVEIIDSTFIDKLLLVHEKSGEILGEKKGKGHKETTPCGISFYIDATRRMDVTRDVDDRILDEFIVFINAKHLKQKYFEGITIDNVDEIRKLINSIGVINISKEVFLDAGIYDVDFCVDFPATRREFREAIHRYYNMVQPRKRDVVKPPYDAQNNLGLSLNNRDNFTTAKPYCKFYHKTVELQEKSTDFAKNHLSGIDYQDVGRFEVNLRNARQFSYFGLKRTKTLQQLLKLKTKKRVLQDAYCKWFVEKKVVPKPAAGTYKDVFISELISLSHQRDIELAYNSSMLKLKGKPERNLRELYHRIMKDLKQEKHEAKRIALQAQLDEFFIDTNRTSDVRTNPPKKGKTTTEK